jgi:hypothetical protein
MPNRDGEVAVATVLPCSMSVIIQRVSEPNIDRLKHVETMGVM